MRTRGIAVGGREARETAFPRPITKPGGPRRGVVRAGLTRRLRPPDVGSAVVARCVDRRMACRVCRSSRSATTMPSVSWSGPSTSSRTQGDDCRPPRPRSPVLASGQGNSAPKAARWMNGGTDTTKAPDSMAMCRGERPVARRREKPSAARTVRSGLRRAPLVASLSAPRLHRRGPVDRRCAWSTRRSAASEHHLSGSRGDCSDPGHGPRPRPHPVWARGRGGAGVPSPR